MQGRNGDVDVENRPVDAVGKGEEDGLGIDIYTHYHV